MLLIKIISQILVGLSSLLAVLLDYKWHDKRKKVFRKFRNILIGLSIISLITSVLITVDDENSKNQEIITLQSKLDSVQNNLIKIKDNGDKLSTQILPFLEIATNKYPDLNSDNALENLKQDLLTLGEKTNSLEKSELERKKKENEFEKLKNTSPSIIPKLVVDKKRKVSIKIEYLNSVPIKIKYSIKLSNTEKLLASCNTGMMELAPPIHNKKVLLTNGFNFPDQIPKENISYFELFIYYESIYFFETQNQNLRSQLVKKYKFDPISDILTEINN